MSDHGKYSQQYPLAVGYRDKPIHNPVVNEGTKAAPNYVAYEAYPAYPWKFGKFIQIGDGRDSQFIRVDDAEPEDHSKDDPLKFWKTMQDIGNAPLNVNTVPKEGKRR